LSAKTWSRNHIEKISATFLLILNPSLKKEGLHAVVRKKGFIFVLSPKVEAGDQTERSRRVTHDNAASEGTGKRMGGAMDL
jgi:hypothetical protein